MEEARRAVALALNATARRIHFTGGGSEANNLAVKGTAFNAGDGRRGIVTTSIEHPSVLAACRWLEKRGFQVTYIDPRKDGTIDPGELARAVTAATCLVTLMLANNETGALQPVREAAALAREHGAVMHTDAVQGAGKIPIDVDDLGVDLLTISGHKFHGPKGVGALYVRKGTDLAPLVHGGGQEEGLRSGTENVTGIIGLGKAAEMIPRSIGAMGRAAVLRDRIEGELRRLVPGTRLNGPRKGRLPNTLNMTLPGIRGESLVLALDRRGIALSSGSACHAGEPEPSHALTAMGISAEDAHCAIRISLSHASADDDVERFVEAVGSILGGEETTVRFVSCR